MEVRKVLRKVTAVAASASFIGATMLGAVAQDLKDYPAPFVKDGKFDAFIVVGADASTEDVLGAVDVGTSLQFELKKESAVVGAGEATISEGLKIEKSGQPFNYGESISSIETTSLDEDDIPSVLADGRFVDTEAPNKNTEDYTQELRFAYGKTANLTFYQDDQDAPKAGDYLFIDDGTVLYNYTLEFDSAIDYDNSSNAEATDDLKTTTLNIQGGLFTITDVKLATTGLINEMTLISGEAVLWLTQNNPITKTIAGVEHVVEVLDVTEDADACQISVDGVSAILDIDETQIINGVQIGITDARAIHAQLQDVDVCQVSLGASEIKLKQNDEVDIDGTDVEGSNVVFTGSAVGQLEEIQVTLDPDEDTWLSAGDEFIDPVFNSWKIAYGGLSADYETYEIRTSGSQDAVLTFVNNNGRDVEIPIFLNDSSSAAKVAFGKDQDELLLANGSGFGANYGQNKCFGSDSVDDCQDTLILGVTAQGEAHVFVVDRIDTADNTTDITDLTYDRKFDEVRYTDGVASALDLSSFGTITVVINESLKSLTVTNSVGALMETDAGASFKLVIPNGVSGTLAQNQTGAIPAFENVTITFDENDADGTGPVPDNKAASKLNVTLLGDATDDEIDVQTPVLTVGTKVGGGDFDISDESDDVKVFTTFVGTKVTYDDEDDNWVKIEFPREEVFGNVFIAPIRAAVSTAEGGLKSYTISKLNVGSAKLDTEITSVGADNLILVGGPCANRVTAQVLGLTYPSCGAASGIAAGTAIIREVVQSSGKVALVVAGYDAADTQRATRVLANYAAYDLSGSSVEVTGTSLTNIQVKKSA